MSLSCLDNGFSRADKQSWAVSFGAMDLKNEKMKRFETQFLVSLFRDRKSASFDPGESNFRESTTEMVTEFESLLSGTSNIHRPFQSYRKLSTAFWLECPIVRVCYARRFRVSREVSNTISIKESEPNSWLHAELKIELWAVEIMLRSR